MLPPGRDPKLQWILVILVVLFLGIFLVFDLSRPDSFIRSLIDTRGSNRGWVRGLADALRRSR